MLHRGFALQCFSFSFLAVIIVLTDNLHNSCFLLQLIEDKVTNDHNVLRAFVFSCSEVGVPSCHAAILPQLHLTLVKKMVHTHCNEVLENRRILSSMDAGVTLEVPLMLRDRLKVMAAKND